MDWQGLMRTKLEGFPEAAMGKILIAAALLGAILSLLS